MDEVEMVIDSLRRNSLSNEWVVILKQKSAECYLPIYIGPSQAYIIKRELVHIGFPEPEDYDCFLAGTDMTNFVLESVIVKRFEDNTFYTKLLLSQEDKSFEVDCPVAKALALRVQQHTTSKEVLLEPG